MAKNNPFGLKYSKSCRYVGLDPKRSSDHGLCCFVDLRFAIKACFELLRTYCRQGILSYGSIFRVMGLNDSILVGLSPHDRPYDDLQYCNLVYCIALSYSGLKKVSSIGLNFDLCYSVLCSFNIDMYA